MQGFAHQIGWLPGLKVGLAVLCNSDLGGTFLRALVACRLIEAAARLEKKAWFDMQVDSSTRAAPKLTWQYEWSVQAGQHPDLAM
jgi:hypothetical protein